MPHLVFRGATLKLLGVLVVLLLVAAIVLTVFLTQQHPQGTGQPEVPAASGLLSVQGTRLIDAQGHTVLLRGAQIASPFNFLSGWQAKTDTAQWLNPKTFQAMRSWHMNALRLPLSGWYYQEPRFLPTLDTVVQQANQAGLYVVLALFDNAKSGSPYGQGADVPKAENVTFWKFMAAHFAHSPMVLFDLLNEPTNLTPQNYLTGGGTVTGSTGKVARIIGLQPLVDAIRSVGARQIIIAPASIPAQYPNVRIHDPNVLYTAHVYSSIADYNPAVWDRDWGSLLGHYPLYYGEWAVLPNSLVPKQCEPYTPTNATTLTKAFLDYMEQHQISWTAWQFRPYYLVQDITSYTPTTFEGDWKPCDTQSHAGMGLVVKQYLAEHAANVVSTNPIP
ncbi:MAG TPA: cellulase family glycosylhydrolase [Ktedonobacteraceae bacterium]|nr:cellulase family glycosylhydrolase [Ktedonobacteraceae bacterium]